MVVRVLTLVTIRVWLCSIRMEATGTRTATTATLMTASARSCSWPVTFCSGVTVAKLSLAKQVVLARLQALPVNNYKLLAIKKVIHILARRHIPANGAIPTSNLKRRCRPPRLHTTHTRTHAD